MHTPAKRAVVSLGIDTQNLPCSPLPLQTNYPEALNRVRTTLAQSGFRGSFFAWDTEFPADAPSSMESPQGYKPFCMLEASEAGFNQILWVDSSIVVRANLDPLFHLLSERGYLLFENDHSVGEYCKDEALATLGITREESFEIPSCWSCVVGLDLRHPKAVAFLERWRDLALDGVTFAGPKYSGIYGWPRTASADPRVKGHRCDQTAASVIALQLGMDEWLSKETFSHYLDNDRPFARVYHKEWQGVGTGPTGALRILTDGQIRARQEQAKSGP